MNEMTQKTERLPLWKGVIESMRAIGFGYDAQWDAEYFEAALKCRRDSSEFAFSMMAIRDVMESEDGYYLESCQNGAAFRIPSAAEHENVARRFDRSVKSYAVRAVLLRSMTLSNPHASLTDAQRRGMEKRMEIAANKLALLNRHGSITAALKKHSPKLISAGQTTGTVSGS